MIKRILPIAMLSAAIIGNTGCSSTGGMKQINGVSYKIVKDAPGKNAKMGDILEYNIYVTVDTLPGKALVLADSRKQGQPSAGRVDSVKQSGDFQAIFPMLSAGDSALVEVSCDTILKTIPPAQQGHLPTWLKKGNKVVIRMSVISVKTMEEYKKDMQAKQEQMQTEMKAKAEQQKPIDDKMLQDYFAKNNIKATKTASGLYYTVSKPGAGAQITKGQQASIMYTGKTLEGKAFDSNVDTAVGHHGTDPLKFIVGMGQMIPGMDEGIALLKKGSKATLYLPSPLAYGAQSPSPNIGANAILIFDVDVVDVKAAPAGNQPQAMPAQ